MYTHISTFTDVHTCSHTYAHTHRLACTYAWSHTDTLTETYSSTDQHKLINTGTQKCIHLYKCTHMFIPSEGKLLSCIISMQTGLSVLWTGCLIYMVCCRQAHIYSTHFSLFPCAVIFKESCIRNIRECISPLYPPLCSHRHSCTFPKHTISCQDFLNDLYNSLHTSTAFAILNNTVWVQVCVGCALYAVYDVHINDCSLLTSVSVELRQGCTARVLRTSPGFCATQARDCTLGTEPLSVPST